MIFIILTLTFSLVPCMQFRARLWRSLPRIMPKTPRTLRIFPRLYSENCRMRYLLLAPLYKMTQTRKNILVTWVYEVSLWRIRCIEFWRFFLIKSRRYWYRHVDCLLLNFSSFVFNIFYLTFIAKRGSENYLNNSTSFSSQKVLLSKLYSSSFIFSYSPTKTWSFFPLWI